MLLGSTEWAETHADELKAKAVIYINTDGNGRGFLEVEGSHPWQHLVNSVANDVIDPQTKVPVGKRQRAAILAEGFESGKQDGPDYAAAQKGDDLLIGPLGSGSDYSSFLQHLGISALNVGYGGEDESDGVYHSIYDSFDHFTRFDDPGLVYGATLSKTVGRLVLRIADSDTPPQRFGDFADAVARYLDEVRKLATDRRAQDMTRVQRLADNSFTLASDPLNPVAPPADEAQTPYVQLAALENAVAKLNVSAKAYDKAYAARGSQLAAGQRAQLNALLRDIDQLLLNEKGLPGRTWYKNMVYAPGRFTGYGAKTLPGVREAIEERRFADADAYAQRIADALNAYSARLDAAAQLIDGK